MPRVQFHGDLGAYHLGRDTLLYEEEFETLPDASELEEWAWKATIEWAQLDSWYEIMPDAEEDE